MTTFQTTECMRSVHFLNSLFTRLVVTVRAAQADGRWFDVYRGLNFLTFTLDMSKGGTLEFFRHCATFRKTFFHHFFDVSIKINVFRGYGLPLRIFLPRCWLVVFAVL